MFFSGSGVPVISLLLVRPVLLVRLAALLVVEEEVALQIVVPLPDVAFLRNEAFHKQLLLLVDVAVDFPQETFGRVLHQVGSLHVRVRDLLLELAEPVLQQALAHLLHLHALHRAQHAAHRLLRGEPRLRNATARLHMGRLSSCFRFRTVVSTFRAATGSNTICRQASRSQDVFDAFAAARSVERRRTALVVYHLRSHFAFEIRILLQRLHELAHLPPQCHLDLAQLLVSLF